LLFQRILAHYRIPLFRALFDRFGILVCCSKERNGSSLRSEIQVREPWLEVIRRLYLSTTDNVVVQDFISPLCKHKPRIVICEGSFGYLTFWMLLLLRSILGYKLIAWSHGIENKHFFQQKPGLKSRLLMSALDWCDAVVFYSNKRKVKVESYVGHSEKHFVAHNTLQTKKLLELQAELSLAGQTPIRKKLGWSEDFHVIFVGRLLKDKRIDLLLQAFEHLSREINVGLHIVGKGPELQLVKDAQGRQSRVYYHGEVLEDRPLGEMLFAADLLVNPGYVGLSIVHGFCFGKPLVTCSPTVTGPFHSPEIEYLDDGANGLLCKSTAESIRDAVLSLLLNPSKLREFSASALKTAMVQCSEERFLNSYKEAIDFCDNSAQKSTGQSHT